MFEGVDKPETAGPVPPPQALIKLREIIINSFFIDFSDYVVVSQDNKIDLVIFVTELLEDYNHYEIKSRNSLVCFALCKPWVISQMKC